MTRKLLVRQGGGTATEVDFLAIATPRKGAPWFDKDQPLFQVGQRFANGEAAMGYFKIVDPAAALSTTGFRTRPWAEVRLTEDASGDELTLGWMRVTANDASRRAPYTGGDQVEHDPQLMDCNMDLRGLPFQSGWHRDAENEGERLNALEAVKLNGASSTGDIYRVTTDITVAAIADGHLADMGDGFDLPVTNYPAGTEPAEVIEDVAGQAGKIWGVVLHHTGGSTHKCLLYVDQDDLTTYTTDVRISDQLADHDPEGDPPTFAPHWLMGAGREQNMEGVVSGLVSIYGGIDGNERTVFVETGDDDDDWETWVGVYNDDQSNVLAAATRRANTILADRRLPYQTHKVSILVNADQAHLVEAGMAIETKSVVMEPGPNKHAWIWRRVAEKTIEPVADGRYWLHLHLEKPRHTHAAGAGAGQPKSTNPKPAPETVPDAADTLDKFFNANDPGGDSIDWPGSLGNQGGSGDGAAGTDYYYYKSNSPTQYNTPWAWSAGDSLRAEGYLGCRSDTAASLILVFTDLAPGVYPGGVSGAHILATHVLATNPVEHSHADEWRFFSVGPFEAPAGTTSVSIGRSGGTIDFDEVSIFLVGDPAANDPDSTTYGDFPHDSTHWLPSDYVEARLANLQEQISALPDAIRNALSWKTPVRVATTTNGTLATAFDAGSTVDGITLAEGDRILIKDQSALDVNGIYEVVASGTPARASDFDSDSEILGAAILVMEGSANEDSIWICTDDDPTVVGTDDIHFDQLSGGGGSGHTIKEDGTPLTARAGLNFQSGIVASDDAGNNETDVDLDWAEDADVSTQAFGDAAATGTSQEVARAGHKHGMPADPVTAHAAASDPHTGYLLESLYDTKGDLIPASADNTPVKLAAGANGLHLVARSGETSGLKWEEEYAALTMVIGNGVAVIATGVKGYIRFPFDCELVSSTILADVSGAIKIDLWVDVFGNYPPDNSDTITGGNEPEIAASGTTDEDTSLTSWDKSCAVGDVMGINVDSCTSIKQVTLQLRVKKT